VAVAAGGVAHQVVGDVVFQARGDGGVADQQVGARIAIAVSRRRIGDAADARAEAALGAELVGRLALAVGVQRPAQAGRAVVHRQRAQAVFAAAVVDVGVAVAVYAVETDTPLVVLAEA